MARQPRVEFEGAVYHVMARGNERARIFHNERDYRLFLETLSESLIRFEVCLHAWCLMPNHFHLAAQTKHANLSLWMAWVQTTFTSRYNRLHRRAGHLFQGRYKAQVVDGSNYAAVLAAYIHLNPVRRKKGGRVEYCGNWEDLQRFSWSSHGCYTGKVKQPLVATQTRWLSYWGSNEQAGRKAYIKDMQRRLGLEPFGLEEGIIGGLVLGGKDWLARVKKLLEKAGSKESVRWKRAVGKTELGERLAQWLRKENDPGLRRWLEAQAGGKSRVEVARQWGCRDGSAVTQWVKRFEQKAQTDKTLKIKIENYRKKMSYVMG